MILFASRPVRAWSRGWFGLVVLIAFGPDSGHLAAVIWRRTVSVTVITMLTPTPTGAGCVSPPRGGTPI